VGQEEDIIDEQIEEVSNNCSINYGKNDGENGEKISNLEQKCHCNRLDLPCGGWVVCLVIWKVPQGATLLSIFLH
jgi:hypothetical protein